MARRAVIYVRTSSESQRKIQSHRTRSQLPEPGRRKEKGLTVVCVYRDIEKYRVKNKLVEPSGTRSDRHGLLTMLKDASKGGFSTHRD